MDFNLWREFSFSEEIALDKIVESGQCFRPKKISPSVYRFITKNSFLYCKQVSEKKLAFYVKEEEDWEKLWCPYFDIERNYRNIRRIRFSGRVSLLEGGYASFDRIRLRC